MDTRQLALIDNERSEREWRLDERTRQVGLEGIAAARRALQDALARTDERTEERSDERDAPTAA